MAVDVSEGNTNMDYAAHVQTYHGFVKLITYGVVGLAVLLMLLATVLL